MKISALCTAVLILCLMSVHIYPTAASGETAKQCSVVEHETGVSYNDLALFISGMSPARSSYLYALTRTEQWQRYAQAANRTWSSFSLGKKKAIQDWASRELPDIRKNCRVLLYPFSGPDYLYAGSFFPDADTYILVGLEPVGAVPELKQLQGDDVGNFYKMLGQSIADALQLSFFKTNDMADEIKCDQPVSGTIPVLMLFIARSGGVLQDIRPFDLDDNGTICYLRAEDNVTGHGPLPRGVEMLFTTSRGTAQHRLVYLSSDISNRGLSRRKNVHAYLNRIAPGMTTYIKSASYLMHKNYFSEIRSLILGRSAAVVQDDSAIPYRFFGREDWDISLYGHYAGPIQLFKTHLEKDLMDAYARSSKALGFRLGYANQSNVLVARRRQTGLSSQREQ